MFHYDMQMHKKEKSILTQFNANFGTDLHPLTEL